MVFQIRCILFVVTLQFVEMWLVCSQRWLWGVSYAKREGGGGGGDVLFSKTVRRSELYKEGDGGSRGEDVLFLVNTGEKLRTSRDNLISACCIRNQQVDYFPKQLGILRFAFQLVGTCRL